MNIADIKVEQQAALLTLLSREKSVDVLLPKIEEVFNQIISQFPWISPFSISTVPVIEKMMLYGILGGVEAMETEGVLISQGTKEKFLYRLAGEWCLDDEYEQLEDIAKAMLEWKALILPHSVKGVKQLIDAGFWTFSLEDTPKVSGDVPRDTNELVSWDEKYVLHGTAKENAIIMTREEWDEMVKRQGGLFDS